MAKDDVSVVERLLPLSALLVTTAASIFLITTKSHSYGGNKVSIVRDNRATIQIIVQVVSHGLALLQLYALRTLFNFATRLRLSSERITLDKYAFWSAGSQLVMDWTLSKTHLAYLTLAVILAATPGAIWAGALTPVDNDTLEVSATLSVPAFSMSSASYWNSEFEHKASDEIANRVDTCQLVHDVRGFIPSCPVPALQGQLLLSASTATTNNKSNTRLHSKLDNSQWSYYGRSFGAGASVGLASPQSRDTAVSALAYAFNETGYNAAVTCFKNETSQLEFKYDNNSPSDFPVYRFTGPLSIVPQNVTDDFPVTTWYGNYERLLAWKARSYNGQNLISIASGKYNYTQFHHIECKVSFTPTVFEVAVNMSSMRITVKPTQLKAVDIEPNGNLSANVIQTINLLSRMSNSYYISIRGDTLQLNYLNMKQRTNKDDEDTITSAVAESFTAIIDDVLVAYGASQIVLAKDQTSIPAQVSQRAVRIGSPVYIYITFSLNSLMLLAVLIEASRLRLWHGLLAFDYANIKCAILAASAGGTSLAEQVSAWNRKEEVDWDGGSTNAAFSHVRVSLVMASGKPRLIGESAHPELLHTRHSASLDDDDDDDDTSPPLSRGKPAQPLGRANTNQQGYIPLSDL
jgi:hypothetical protein